MALASMDVFPYHTHLIAQGESHITCKSTQNWTPLKKKQERVAFHVFNTTALAFCQQHDFPRPNVNCWKRKPHGSMKQWHHECKLWIPEAPCSSKGNAFWCSNGAKTFKNPFQGEIFFTLSPSQGTSITWPFEVQSCTPWSPWNCQKISCCAILQHRNSKFQTNQCHSIVKQKVRPVFSAIENYHNQHAGATIGS